MQRPLQYGFAAQYRDAAFDRPNRERKAAKVLAILEEALGPLGGQTLLDIGCSAGFMSRCYAARLGRVVGTDIDVPALAFAAAQPGGGDLAWAAMDSQTLAFPDACFDVVTCTHIYEHVPDARRLLDEIYRVLRPGGACFFSAGNRLSLIEPHYQLPLLSVLPKWTAHLYLRLLGRGDHYYETHLTYFGLRRLVARFELEDYTRRVVDAPARYHAEDMLPPGSRRQALARAFLRFAYGLCPTYLWVLRKPADA